MTHPNNPKNTLQIIEWESFSSDHIKSIVKGDGAKAQKIFDELKDFASYDKNRFFLSTDKGGKALKAQNYVGLIQTKSGFCLEILPKIYDKEPISKEKLKNTKLLIEMLKTLKNFPAKASNFSNLSISKTSLLEIFIQMFLNELISLIKKGIKRDYYPIEKNCFYLKGKLLFSHHIKHNLAHQERFYTRADEYSADIPQNRLIKSTLELFSKKPLSAKTQNLLLECRFVFDDIPSSKNIEKDFTSCDSNRSLKYYHSILAWCKIFLKRQNFTFYAGNTIAMAFLFDMNHLFESYITHHLKLHSPKEWNIKSQDKSKYLLDGNQCKLIPDIIATHTIIKKTIVLDTKWKIIKHADIASSDVYQMWAYASKYKSKKVILIYPKIGQCEKTQESIKFKPEFFIRQCKEVKCEKFECVLEITLIDLEQNMKNQIIKIFEKLYN